MEEDEEYMEEDDDEDDDGDQDEDDDYEDEQLVFHVAYPFWHLLTKGECQALIYCNKLVGYFIWRLLKPLACKHYVM